MAANPSAAACKPWKLVVSLEFRSEQTVPAIYARMEECRPRHIRRGFERAGPNPLRNVSCQKSTVTFQRTNRGVRIAVGLFHVPPCAVLPALN